MVGRIYVVESDGGQTMTTNAAFRTCPETGLKIDRAAETLIKANAVVAVVFLAIGGLFGLLVALPAGLPSTCCRPTGSTSC